MQKTYKDRYMKLIELPRFARWCIEQHWTAQLSSDALIIERDGRHKEYHADGKWVAMKLYDFPLVAAWRFDEEWRDDNDEC